jgi:RNA binding exosome subunit
LKSQIQSVEVSYFIHATEDRARVDSAVTALLGTEAEATVEALEGHFGNQIVVVRHHIVGDAASRVFASMVSRMPEEMKRSLAADLSKYVDEHSALYLRLDKQKLLSGKVALAESDPVRVKVKPRLYVVKESAAQFYGRLLG